MEQMSREFSNNTTIDNYKVLEKKALYTTCDFKWVEHCINLHFNVNALEFVINEIQSRHTVVCHVAQENGACKRNEYFDRNNKVTIFTHM